MYDDGHKIINTYHDGHKVWLGDGARDPIPTASYPLGAPRPDLPPTGTSVPNHMGLPIITDERMPTGMILLMGPNGEIAMRFDWLADPRYKEG